MIDDILKERGDRYGSFEDNSKVSQQIKDILHAGSSWGKCDYHQKEALEMIAHKIARIINGDPDYKDSWTDIIGYARLVEETL